MNKITRALVAAVVLSTLLLSGTATAAAPPEASEEAVCSAYYVVRWGDNLTRIAVWHGTTVERLATLNGIANPNRIYAGQSLCVQAVPSGPQVTTYTVRWGDTLYAIAWRFGVGYWELVAANNLANPNWIYAGQVLKIPTAASPALIDSIQIHLIALGDNGQSGKKIGCDDSVVPVEVAISPTSAPLRASLNELLSIQDAYYGQSGLYNALHQSDLWVEDVTIVDRHAVVHLAGSVSVSGTCDVPRVTAQLQETALRFSTVDSVTIYVNDLVLEDVLN